MKNYTYYFADGTKNTIQIDDKWYDILYKMDEDERKARYNYGRHNVPLSAFSFGGEKFADPNGDIFIKFMQQVESKKFDEALDTLTDSQRKLFEAVYYEKRKVIDIAAEQCVGQPAISNRLERIKKKIARNLELDRDILPFSSLNSEGT